MRWEREELFFSGDAYYAALLGAVAQATHCVDFESYIFELDPIGESILDALARTARRGIRVRLLVDGIGSLRSAGAIGERLRGSGVEFKIYHPVGLAFRLIRRLNDRNHRKSCVIDGTDAWLGSVNVSVVHSIRHWGTHAWRDTAVHVQGPEVRLLTDAFERAWKDHRRLRRFADWWPKRARVRQGSLLLLNNTMRSRRLKNRELIARIDSATDRIWLATPYFIPGLRIFRALLAAASRGVRVRVLLSEHSDIFGIQWVSAIYQEALVGAGAQVYYFQPSNLHSKVLIVDQWAIVGSTNFNHRSFFHDLEADAVVTYPQNLAALTEQFETDCARSRLCEAGFLKHRGFWARLAGKIGYLMRKWL